MAENNYMKEAYVSSLRFGNPLTLKSFKEGDDYSEEGVDESALDTETTDTPVEHEEPEEQETEDTDAKINAALDAFEEKMKGVIDNWVLKIASGTDFTPDNFKMHRLPKGVEIIFNMDSDIGEDEREDVDNSFTEVMPSELVNYLNDNKLDFDFDTDGTNLVKFMVW